MYYFKEKEDIIEKYLVSFSKETVEKLKIEIIDKCSEIEHHEYEGAKGPNEFDYLRIRNYEERYVRTQESRDSLQYPDIRIYHYSYDEYKFPYLVSLIDELLKGNISIIDKILNSESEIENKSINERIKIASDELDNIDNLDIVKKRTKLDELQQLITLQRINKNQKSVKPYYLKLRSLITLKLIDTIKKEEIKRVDDFFGNQRILGEEPKKLQKFKR